MRISNQQRRELATGRVIALRQTAPFRGRLKKLRKQQIDDLFKNLERVPLNDWIYAIPEFVTEPYMYEYLNKLYRIVGTSNAKRATEKFVNRKEDVWEGVMDSWFKQNAGSKILTITGSFKEWLTEEIGQQLNEKLGIENIVQNIYKQTSLNYSEIAEWEIRRIVQTETMTALNVSSNESVNALQIPYTKTWVISGNNTRPGHLAMDGVTIEANELFNVDGEDMEYPTDASHGAGAGNIINCACGVIHNPK